MSLLVLYIQCKKNYDLNILVNYMIKIIIHFLYPWFFICDLMMQLLYQPVYPCRHNFPLLTKMMLTHLATGIAKSSASMMLTFEIGTFSSLRVNLSKRLFHWGWVMHIYVSNLTIIGSDNGLLPGWHQAIIWTNDGILLIRPLRTNSEILIRIHKFSFQKKHLKMSSAKWRPFCLSLEVLSFDVEEWY